ncbi:MAG: hypothetical protein QM488_14785 [Rhizobiaceae bacterium]
MNIVTLKKSILTALTVAVVATGSLSATTAPAAAGGKHFGSGLGVGLAIGLIGGGYRRHHGRHGYGHRYYGNGYRDCWTERRWRRNHWGERYSVRVQICN